jgi:PAS domain S-box-containing protein
MHTFLDVTQVRRQEQALVESEQMFRLLSEQSLMSVAILQDGVYKYANQAMSDLCEYSVDEISNWSSEEFLAVVHPADRDVVMAQARMKQQGDPRQKTHYVFRIMTKSGNTKWVEIYSKTIQFKERPANLLTMIDITSRKKVEEALELERRRFQVLVDNAPFGMILIHADGTFVYTNPKFTEIFGYELRNVPNGKEWFRKAYPDPQYRKEIIKTWLADAKAKEPGDPRPRTFSVCCKD